MGLGNWLKRRHKSRQSIWVIKQVDEALLHLCGEASVEASARLLERLRDGDFHGAVRMQETGALLNSGQFAALIPQDDFQLNSERDAIWRGRHWQIAWTPQRCWLHEGRLVALPSQVDGHPCLVSSEDVSGIRAKAQAPQPPAPYFALEALDCIQHNDSRTSGQHDPKGDRSR